MGFIKNYLRSLRIRQWVKNLFIFAPILFSLNFTNLEYLKNSVLAFFLFSLIAGNIYVLNDIIDRKKDIHHPKKKNRPIASGSLKVLPALSVSVFLLIITLSAGFFFNRGFFIISLIYVFINFFYSVYLKNIAIFDVFIIAIGFVLRVMIGGKINSIYLSPWLFIVTFLLALFLGLVKRRQELVLGERDGWSSTRISLKNYSLPLIDQLISITTSATLISYIIYVLNPDIQNYFHTKDLYLTVPFVIFGIFRYLFLTYIKEKGENPEEVLFSDFPFLINLILWIGVFVFLIYK